MALDGPVFGQFQNSGKIKITLGVGLKNRALSLVSDCCHFHPDKAFDHLR